MGTNWGRLVFTGLVLITQDVASPAVLPVSMIPDALQGNRKCSFSDYKQIVRYVEQ